MLCTSRDCTINANVDYYCLLCGSGIVLCTEAEEADAHTVSLKRCISQRKRARNIARHKTLLRVELAVGGFTLFQGA